MFLILYAYSNYLLLTPEKRNGEDIKMRFSLIGVAYVVNNEGRPIRSSIFEVTFTCSFCYVSPRSQGSDQSQTFGLI